MLTFVLGWVPRSRLRQKEITFSLKEKDMETYGYIQRTEAKGERIMGKRSQKENKN